MLDHDIKPDSDEEPHSDNCQTVGRVGHAGQENNLTAEGLGYRHKARLWTPDEPPQLVDKENQLKYCQYLVQMVASVTGATQQATRTIKPIITLRKRLGLDPTSVSDMRCNMSQAQQQACVV